MGNKLIIAISIVLFIVLAIFGNYNIQEMHSGGFYRANPIYKDLGPVIYYQEGLYATVTVQQLIENARSLFINGKGQGGSSILDLRTNFLLAYLPNLINPKQKNVLVIGLGTGTTSGQLALANNVTTVEIEPKILGAQNYFSDFNLNVLKNPNTTIIIDDGRNYLLKSSNKYDTIVQETSDPWQSFSSNLFSKEFLELAASHLNQRGLYLQWVPIYQMSPEDFKSFYATFNSVFPYTAAFANIEPTEDTPIKFNTSEIILIGSKEEMNLSNFDSNYNILPSVSKQELGAIKLDSGDKVSSLILFDNKDIDGYAQSAPLITDDRPILEFSTAKEVLNQDPEAVIENINKFLEGGKNSV